jgi:predicted nucleotidyltransferase
VADVERIAERLRAIPNVVAVVLGGSRAAGTHRPDSDWDFGIYYEGELDVSHVRALGYDGYVSEVGEWSPLMNGGAWFEVDGEKVDVIYRSVDAIAHWIAEAEEGRFRVELLNGYLAGFPTTVLVGEVALCNVLHGSLPFAVPTFPEPLRVTAPQHWRGRRDFHEMYAGFHEQRGDDMLAVANRTRALVEEAHARMAERGEWVLNEKGLLARAGL